MVSYTRTILRTNFSLDPTTTHVICSGRLNLSDSDYYYQNLRVVYGMVYGTIPGTNHTIPYGTIPYEPFVPYHMVVVAINVKHPEFLLHSTIPVVGETGDSSRERDPLL